jgi:hypothetical protein
MLLRKAIKREWHTILSLYESNTIAMAGISHHVPIRTNSVADLSLELAIFCMETTAFAHSALSSALKDINLHSFAASQPGFLTQ